MVSKEKADPIFTPALFVDSWTIDKKENGDIPEYLIGKVKMEEKKSLFLPWVCAFSEKWQYGKYKSQKEQIYRDTETESKTN